MRASTGRREVAAYTFAMIAPVAQSVIPTLTTPASSIDDGVDRKRLRVIKQRFMAVNGQRLQRARSNLDARQLTFLDLLPLLFHSNHPMLPGYISHQTPHGLSDYNPSKTDISRAQRVARSFNFARQPHMRRSIHALFLMGSCGTVAQSESSDFDIWVCHAADLDQHEQELLRRKCDDITGWANTLRLEVHFFLMEGEKFRLGEREDVSTEDCGSSQHYLLLDEFYRTGLLLAGRMPIWWLVPPDEEPQYDHYAETLRHKRFVKNTDTLDFGSVGQIPAGEFIGAGIWQLTKAIDSPYKSVIKLLLSEVYASEYPHIEPLSNAFKRAIYDNQVDVDELDPYVMMYRKIEKYLLARNESHRLELVRRCFYFKVGKAITRGQTRRTKSWQRLLLEKMVAQWQWQHSHLLNLDARSQWKIGRVLNEQRELVTELTNSYRFLLDFARRAQAGAIINGRDMTVLGRKLFASFERKAGKVEAVNPGIAPNLAEDVLTFFQQSNGNKREPSWAVYAEMPRDVGGKPPLRRAADLLALLTWCHINGLLAWHTQLHVIEGAHGVGEFELHNLVRVLRAQLPVHTGESHRKRRTESDPTQERFLSPNRPQTMQLFINVGIDPLAQLRSRGMELLSSQTDSLRYSGLRENLVLGVDQVVLNSWGEVTTRSYNGPFALLQCLRDYLLMLPPQQHPGLPTLRIDCFCPTRATAIAARVEQLFQDIAACYYSGTRPASARYVLEMQREFYVLQLLDGQPNLQRAPTYAALLELLGREQRSYSPIVLDRHCLQNSLLAIAAQTARPERVQVFYQRRASHDGKHGSDQETADVLVLDEMGSVYAFSTPFYDELTLLQPLDQFLQSTRLRQCSEIASTDYGDEPIGETLNIAIDYFELIGEANHVRCERRTLADDGAGMHFTVQAIADYDRSGNLSFTIYCNQREFSELEYGDGLFDEVARHILSHRQARERYPCYITDLDLSRSINEGGGVQTIHYLRYKQRLERALNDALNRIN